MENSKVGVSTLAMALIALAIGLLSSQVPGVSGLSFGLAFSMSLLGVVMSRWVDTTTTIGDIITRERFFRMRPLVLAGMLIGIIFVPWALGSNLFIPSFIAAPVICALILLSGSMAVAANSYLRGYD